MKVTITMDFLSKTFPQFTCFRLDQLNAENIDEQNLIVPNAIAQL